MRRWQMVKSATIFSAQSIITQEVKFLSHLPVSNPSLTSTLKELSIIRNHRKNPIAFQYLHEVFSCTSSFAIDNNIERQSIRHFDMRWATTSSYLGSCLRLMPESNIASVIPSTNWSAAFIIVSYRPLSITLTRVINSNLKIFKDAFIAWLTAVYVPLSALDFNLQFLPLHYRSKNHTLNYYRFGKQMKSLWDYRSI